VPARESFCERQAVLLCAGVERFSRPTLNGDFARMTRRFFHDQRCCDTQGAAMRRLLAEGAFSAEEMYGGRALSLYNRYSFL
jgi:hypothetical protein